MAKNKAVKKHVRGANTYTCCLRKELGFYPKVIRGVNVLCLLAMVPTRGGGQPNLNSKNPRVEGELGGSKSQAKIQKALKAKNSNVLQTALENNQGQIEHLTIWNNTVIEGNRRQNIFRNLPSTPEMLVCILPDELDEKLVRAFERTIHLSGKEEWFSAVKSKLAFDLYQELKNWKDVTEELQFKSVAAAKNYANAYVWHREAQTLALKTPKGSKVDIGEMKHWSKFHHACNPTLKKYFGFDEETETFSEPDRFKWFCQLIKSGKLTDCRQSDGIIRPIIAVGNNDEDDDTYINFKKIIEKDGADEAWRKWRLFKKKDREISQLTELIVNIKHINKAKARWNKLKGNKMLQGKVLEALAVLEEFSDKIADAAAEAA